MGLGGGNGLEMCHPLTKNIFICIIGVWHIAEEEQIAHEGILSHKQLLQLFPIQNHAIFTILCTIFQK